MWSHGNPITPVRSALLVITISVLARGVALASMCSLPVWTMDGDQEDCRFGTIAPAGDVNGDGFADVLIGSYNYDHGETDEDMWRRWKRVACGVA